jgi:hypothetical protein
MAKPNPKQKNMYDMMVLQAMRLLYEPDQAKMVKQMAESGDPTEAIASTTAMILKQIQTAAKSAGHELDMRFIAPAGKEIMGHIVEMLVAFKVVPQEQAQQVLQGAVQVFAEITQGGGKPQPQPQQGGMLAQGV